MDDSPQQLDIDEGKAEPGMPWTARGLLHGAWLEAYCMVLFLGRPEAYCNGATSIVLLTLEVFLSCICLLYDAKLFVPPRMHLFLWLLSKSKCLGMPKENSPT